MGRVKIWLVVLSCWLCSLGSTGAAHAVVQWARQYQLPCSGCHAGFPRLNETGIRFRQLGYRFDPDEKPRVVPEQLIGPTWAPGMTLGTNDSITLQRRGVKIHVGGAVSSQLAFLVQPTPGEKNAFNMAQAMVNQGAFRLTAGRVYAWENGGGVGAGDRFPTANLPRMFTTLGKVTAGGLGNGFRLDRTDSRSNTVSLFSTDLRGSGTATPTFGLSLTRRYDSKGLGYAEVFGGSSRLPGGGTAQRIGATVSHGLSGAAASGPKWVLLGGALYGSGGGYLGAGFLEADWLPTDRSLVLIRTDLEQGTVARTTRAGLALGAALQLTAQQRLDLDWVPVRVTSTTAPLSARLRFFF
jgi:hypothetical protein